MREKKVSTGQKIWIFLLTVFFIINCSYIVYDKVFLPSLLFKKKTLESRDISEKEIKKEKTVRPLSMAEEKMLLEQIDDYNTYLSLEYPISSVFQLSNQKKLLFAYSNMEKLNRREFMQSELKKNVEYYFGKHCNISYEDILCEKGDGNLYIYDDTRKVYTLDGEHSHDGISSFSTHSFYVDGKVYDEKEYQVDVNVIYASYCNGTCEETLSYYQSAKDAMEGDHSIITREEAGEFTEYDYEKVKNQLETMRFTFQKDDKGNYGLVSVTLAL